MRADKRRTWKGRLKDVFRWPHEDGVWGLSRNRSILFCAEQGVVVGGVVGFDFEEPALSVRVAVGRFGCRGEVFIDGGDFSGERGVNIGGGFDRFDYADLVFCRQFGTDFGQFDKDDVAQQFLGVEGDAELTQIGRASCRERV